MKTKFGLVKAVLSWGLMVAFLVVGVIATQNNKINLGGNFKFDAKDVKAQIAVSQALVKPTTEIEKNVDFSNVSTVTLDENKQVAGDIVLGNEGVIEFTSNANAYYLKIEVKNTFKVGGRDILVEYYCSGEIEIDGLEIGETEPRYNTNEEVRYTEDGSCIILPADKSLIMIFSFVLDTDVSNGFDTSLQDGNIELVWLSLARG